VKFAATIFSFLLLGGLVGCDGIVAEQMTEPPNLNSPTRGKDAPPDLLAEHHVWRQLRVAVGPPSATISVWIVQSAARRGKVWINQDQEGGFHVGTAVANSTQPTTDISQPATQNSRMPKGILFLLHGLGDDKEGAPYEFYSYVMANFGYRVVLVDLRGHGRSTGDLLTYGFLDSRDMKQVLDELIRQNLIVGNVGVIGVSYGASTSILWASIDPRVKAVVALEPFSTLRDAALDGGPILLGSDAHLFSQSDLIDIAHRVGKRGGFDPEKLSPLTAISHMATPILLIHGTSDTFLHPAESVRLHNADPDHSRLILYDGADHLNLWIKGAKTITAEADAWFGKYLNDSTIGHL
jgi:pimeloyl-ACP methyl ester carboxylesterase